MYKPFYKSDCLEVSLDETGRGTLFGSTWAGAVYWDPNVTHPLIIDSKKLTKRKRLMAYDFIKEEAIGCATAKIEAKEIDKINIRNAAIKAMHIAIDNTFIPPQHILVDGDYFKFYVDKTTGEVVSHTCVIGGDRQYLGVAAASILAKVEHDKEIEKLCDEYPELEKYDLRNNMGYGTKKHCDAIAKYGPHIFHRKTFSKVKEFL
jgi:ribonuclease HII